MDMYQYFKMLNEAVERNARERDKMEASKDKTKPDATDGTGGQSSRY